MKNFDVQTVEISSTYDKAFDYIADPHNLPEWTNAFKSVSDGRAMLETPEGTVETALEVKASRQQGTIDWTITFPDESVATAFSRLIANGGSKNIYSFTLMAPPVPLEQLEGTLEAQSQILHAELIKLSAILAE
jgi:hypothetical protein